MNTDKMMAIVLFSSLIFFTSLPSFAETLNQQAQTAYQQGDYKKAAYLLEQVLTLMRQQPGENHPDTLIVMDNLAQLYQMQGRTDLALSLFEKALPLSQQLLGEKNPDTLRTMNNLGELYRLQGEFNKAEPLLEKALQLREQLLGEKDNATLTSMNNLANLYCDLGKYELAEPLFTKALNLRIELFGKKHPDTLLSMNNLAGFYTAQGRYDLAQPLYEEALNFTQEIFGEKHPDTLISLNNLARLYHNQGRYDIAEPLFLRNLQLSKEILGENHPKTISSMNNLAMLYKAQGRYELAQPLLEQALKLNQQILGENHPVTLISVNNLAGLYKDQAKYNLAQPLYEKVLALSKKILGDNHPDTLIRMGNLAVLYELEWKYKAAEHLYLQALQLSQKTLGENHPQTILSLNNLGWFYFTTQNYKKAEPLLKKATELNQALVGEKNPSSLLILANLAENYQAMGKWQKAEKLWQQHLRLSNQFLDEVLWGAGEKTRFAYLTQQRDYRDNYLTFYSLHNTKETAKEALYFSLTRKGQLLRIASEMNALTKNTPQLEIKHLVQQFSDKKQQLANLSWSRKAEKAQVQNLEKAIDDLEMQLSQKVAVFRQKQQDVTPEQVLDKLTEQQVLIDFLLFEQVDFKTQHAVSLQMIALVANKKHGIKLINLGDYQVIRDVVNSYRQHILPNAQGQLTHRDDILKPISQNLYQLIWKPLLPYIKNKTEVYLIPDGNLHLLPFKALQDKQGHYLAEKRQITLLSSARDIVLPPLSGKTNEAVIFAAPAFGEQEEKNVPKATRSVATRWQDIYFAPLEGAAMEGKLLNELIKTKLSVEIYQAQAASETKVETVNSPRLLHFATHGFFLENQLATPEISKRAGIIENTSANLLSQVENPLLRSGLALTGANLGVKGQKQLDGTDGILTALEVLGLNLAGTDLVTLSACETGVGKIQVGEGVYSLTRAFQEAGAKSVLSTLWSVADEQTKQFMQEFYTLVLNGETPQQALQKTQLKFIQDKVLKDPFFWAAFTVVGI